MYPIDQVELAFDAASLQTLNVILGFIMFGVALDLKVQDFVDLARDPKAPILGLFTQFLVLPAAAYLLVRLLGPVPSMGLGMLLVSSCPGGNISNFITHVGGGKTSVSVGMTAVSTLAAIVATPLNFRFWGGLNPDTAGLLTTFNLDPMEMLRTVAVLLGLPVVIGMGTAHFLPRVARFLRKPFKVLSLVFFMVFIVVAFGKNLDHFLTHIGSVFWPVLLLNALALGLGYGVATAGGLGIPERRAVCIEVGIQNSGLALVLIFNFFGGLGGMAVIAAWWGIWHMVGGFTLAAIWTLRDRRSTRAQGLATGAS